MPKLTIENIKNKVFENSLQTCEYISGYETTKSLITVKCLIHNLEFKTSFENVRRDSRKHHICPICQKEDKNKRYKNNRKEVECAYCKTKFFKSLSKLEKSKSGLYFCCREHKDLAQSLNSGKEFQIIRPEHYGSENPKAYRETAFKNYAHQCAICGWAEDKDVLEVHHIDENRNNNNVNNLIILCPICHKKLTTHKYKLIDRKFIIKK